MFAGHSIVPVVSCLPEEFSEFTQLVVSWVGTSFPIMGDHAIGSIVYNTFDACQQDKPRVVQNSLSSGNSTVGAICEGNQDGNGYVVGLFSNAPTPRFFRNCLFFRQASAPRWVLVPSESPSLSQRSPSALTVPKNWNRSDHGSNLTRFALPNPPCR